MIEDLRVENLPRATTDLTAEPDLQVRQYIDEIQKWPRKDRPRYRVMYGRLYMLLTPEEDMRLVLYTRRGALQALRHRLLPQPAHGPGSWPIRARWCLIRADGVSERARSETLVKKLGLPINWSAHGVRAWNEQLEQWHMLRITLNEIKETIQKIERIEREIGRSAKRWDFFPDDRYPIKTQLLALARRYGADMLKYELQETESAPEKQEHDP